MSLRSWTLACVVLSVLSACNDPTSPMNVRVRALHAVPGDETADLRHDNSTYLASELRFGDLSSELTVPDGAHELALVVPPELGADDAPACRDSDAPPSPCTPDVVLAAVDQDIEAGEEVLMVFSERHEDNRTGFVVPLRAPNDGSPYNDSDASVRFVHAMPGVGTVTIEGVAADQLRFGFRAVTEDQSMPSAGGAIVVRDTEGEVVFRTTLDLTSEKDTLVYTVVLVGDGSDAAPFSAILVPG